MTRQDKIITAALAFSACWLWSTAFVAIKIGLRHMPPIMFAGMRFIGSGLILLPLCGKPRTYLLQLRTNWRLVVKVALYQTYILYGLFFWGMQYVPGAIGAVIIGSSPLIAAVMAHFMLSDDRMRSKTMISIGMGIIGIAIIAFSRHNESTYDTFQAFIGIGLLLIASISSAIGNILVAKGRKQVAPLPLNAFQFILAGAALLTTAFLLPASIEPLPSGSLPAEFYYALLWLIFVSATGFSIWFYLLQRPGVKVSGLNIWKFVIPVSGAILAWILLPDESPGIAQFAGMVCVGTAVLLNYAGKKNS